MFGRRQLVAGLDVDFAGLLVDHVGGDVAAGQVLGRNQLSFRPPARQFLAPGAA